MPKPKEGESKDDFMSRCIQTVMDDGSADSTSQATAMCSTMYDGKSVLCSDCHGKGYKTETKVMGMHKNTDHMTCPTCNGSGTVPKKEDDGETSEQE